VKTEYNSVEEIVSYFEQFWVPYTTWELGFGESGIRCFAVIDKKSNKVYLERYDSTIDIKNVYCFEKSDYPDKWRFEEDGTNSIDFKVIE